MQNIDVTEIETEDLIELSKQVAAEVRKRRENGRINTKRYKSMQCNNSSGQRGVTFNKAAGRWQAKISGRHLGYFKTKGEAGDARRLAEVEFWGREVG